MTEGDLQQRIEDLENSIRRLSGETVALTLLVAAILRCPSCRDGEVVEKLIEDPLRFSDDLLIKLDPDRFEVGISTVLTRVKSVITGGACVLHGYGPSNVGFSLWYRNTALRSILKHAGPSPDGRGIVDAVYLACHGNLDQHRRDALTPLQHLRLTCVLRPY